MKFSKEAKITILAVLCSGIGFILGQMNMEKAINLPGFKEAHLFGIHAAYLRGCVESNGPGKWEECVQGAINATKDVRDILDQEPQILFNPPVLPEQPKTGHEQIPNLEKMLKKQNTIMI